MSIPAGDASRRRVLDPRLKLSDRLRTFTHGGRDYALTSAVPLTYLAASPGLLRLLRRFSSPRCVGDVVEAPPGAAVESFVGMLHRVGVLVDADSPDPVHSFQGGAALTRTLYLYPTSSCNLRCVYCYASSGPSAGPQMSSEQAAVAVDDFFSTLDSGTRRVQRNSTGGGEPTLNFPVMGMAWERFAGHARRRGLPAAVFTITNGLFGPEVLRVLQQPEWHVEVSYDGPRQGSQRPAASPSDGRDRVVRNLRTLRDAGKLMRTRATLTRDGSVSACTETCDGHDMPECRDCFLVDTCAGGCPSRARAETGDAHARDEDFCARSLVVNPAVIADLAAGKLLPDAGWQPVEARLDPSESPLPGVSGRLVALVPPFASRRWNADPSRRPFLPTDGKAPQFFHLPAAEE